MHENNCIENSAYICARSSYDICTCTLLVLQRGHIIQYTGYAWWIPGEVGARSARSLSVHVCMLPVEKVESAFVQYWYHLYWSTCTMKNEKWKKLFSAVFLSLLSHISYLISHISVHGGKRGGVHLRHSRIANNSVFPYILSMPSFTPLTIPIPFHVK